MTSVQEEKIAQARNFIVNARRLLYEAVDINTDSYDGMSSDYAKDVEEIIFELLKLEKKL